MEITAHKPPFPLKSGFIQETSQLRLVVTGIAVTACVLTPLFLGVTLQNAQVAGLLAGGGAAIGLAVGLSKRLVAGRCGAEDRSLLQWASRPMGSTGTWLACAAISTSLVLLLPASLSTAIILPAACLLGTEHATGKAISAIRQAPHHAQEIVKTACYLWKEYPELKVILPGLAAVVGFALLPGSLGLHALFVPGLAAGLLGLGLARKACEPAIGRDFGNLKAGWKDLDKRERLTKIAFAAAGAATSLAMVSLLLVAAEPAAWHYLIFGAASTAFVQLWYPALVSRTPSLTKSGFATMWEGTKATCNAVKGWFY